MDSIKIKYVTLTICALLTLIALLWLRAKGGDNATFDNYLKIGGFGTALTTLIYTAMNLNLVYQAQIANQRLSQKKYSSGLINKYSSPSYIKLTQLAHDLKIDIKNLDSKQVAAHLNKPENTQFKHALAVTLNFLEHLAICIEHDLADEDLLYDYFKSIVVANYFALKTFIEQTRLERSNNRIFVKFEELAISWSN